ncbi:MAG: MAPEG family protein [Burkholderiales bacterium]|nr:MAPEG family protein [Burkholderiales bacterium]
MHFVDIVALAALLQFFVFAALVGRARGKYGVKAPAITGHEMFERALRVQMNTLELLMLFVPALYIAARYWPAGYVAACGAVFLVGRVLYQQAYMSDPGKRGPGFLLSIAPCFALIVAGLVGAVLAALKGSA